MTISTRTLLATNAIARGVALTISYANIKVKPGFNARDENEDFEASVEALADHIFKGGYYPPLLLRFDDEGNAFIVDGHRRHAAIGKAIARGAPIDRIDFKRFEGNEAEAVAAIMTSAEGRPLSPLEKSVVVKRLIAFGLSSAQVGDLVNLTAARVDQLALLSNASVDVKAMVQAGAVSASIATETVRKHGDKAGEVLAKEQAKATAAGKKKVTKKTMAADAEPKPKKRTTEDEMRDAMKDLLDGLTEKERTMLADIALRRTELSTVMIDGNALLRLFAIAGIDATTKDMFDDKDAA